MYRLGVDVGGTFIKAGVVDENKNIIKRISIPTEAEQGYTHSLQQVALAANMAAESVGVGVESFPIVGFGVPGPVDNKAGRVIFCPNVKGWQDIAFREDMKPYLPNKIMLGNDANCAVLGETLAGAAVGCEDVMMLTLGTGVGGGVIASGRMLTGGDGAGIELGHVLLNMDGELCGCGLKGCVEAYCSVTSLIRQTKKAMEAASNSLMHGYAKEAGLVDGRTAFECSKQGDAAAMAVVDKYTDYLSAAIASLVACFRPQRVLIGGGLSNQGDYLMDMLNEKVPGRVFSNARLGSPQVCKALLGNDAGTVGAAFLDMA